jgi:hypothetical protein
MSELEQIAHDLAVALSALRMSRGLPNGIVDEAVQEALDAYDRYRMNEESIVRTGEVS